MNAPNHFPLQFDRKELLDLMSALDHAQSDANEYFKNGGADVDYLGDEESLDEYKAMTARWCDLLTTLNREAYGS